MSRRQWHLVLEVTALLTVADLALGLATGNNWYCLEALGWASWAAAANKRLDCCRRKGVQ